jgi:hypothetical protein
LKIDFIPWVARFGALVVFIFFIGGLIGRIPMARGQEHLLPYALLAFFGIFTYLMIFGVWKKSINIDVAKGVIQISEGIPMLTKPKEIEISKLFHVGVNSFKGSHNNRSYYLAFKLKNEKVVTFGYGSAIPKSLYLKWCKEINTYLFSKT